MSACAFWRYDHNIVTVLQVRDLGVGKARVKLWAANNLYAFPYLLETGLCLQKREIWRGTKSSVQVLKVMRHWRCSASGCVITSCAANSAVRNETSRKLLGQKGLSLSENRDGCLVGALVAAR